MKKHVVRHAKSKFFFIFFVSFSTLSISQSVLASSECGDPYKSQGRAGPWDYSDPFSHSEGSAGGGSSWSRVYLVEIAHFQPSVERLQSAKTGTIMTSIDYTLGVFPNHHRALWTLIRYDKRLGGKLPNNFPSHYPITVECYFDRAFQFKPRDPKVHQLYGSYFHLNHNYKKALKYYLKAEKLSDNDSQLIYNIGLLYYDMENYAKAKEYAEKAIKLGFRVKGLKNKLIKNGHW